MKQKRVLIVGASYSAVPLFQYLKRLGCYISICGRLKNEPCHAYADQSFFIDYSKKAHLLALCKKENFDCIVPSCNDYAYNSASYVASKLNRYPGFDDIATTLLLHTKSGFKQLTMQNDLFSPKIVRSGEDLNAKDIKINASLLVKPDNAFSGIGITKVNNRAELTTAIKLAQQHASNNKVIVEEFVQGSLHSHSAFVQNGDILTDFFVDEYCTQCAYQVNSSCLTVELSDKIKQQVRDNIGKLISSLNLVDGLLHTQFITNGKNIWFIETMRRSPGDLYGTLINMSTGFDYAGFYCNPFLNRKNNLTDAKPDIKYVARHTVSVAEECIFDSFAHTVPTKKTILYPLKENGQILDKAPYEKFGIIFSEFDSKSKLAKYTPIMADFMSVNKITRNAK